jgi:chromosomal replication initiator protein
MRLRGRPEMDGDGVMAFEDFIVGSGSMKAYWAVHDLVTGVTGTPLLITGGTGTGKSYLLRVAEQAALERGSKSVGLFRAHDILENYAAAGRFGSLAPFYESLSKTDLMLVDDVDFLLERPATQEALAEVIEYCMGKGGRVVFTTWRLDKKGFAPLEDIFQRCDRMALKKPGTTTREAILRRFADVFEGLPDDVIAELAEQSEGANCWELHGLVMKAVGRRRLAG